MSDVKSNIENTQNSGDKSEIINEESLVGLVERAVELGDHKILDNQNYINLSYYYGAQWISLDTTTGTIFVPEQSEEEIRFTANKIQPIVRSELSKITKDKPIVNVMPADNTDEDIEVAQLGDSICEGLEFNLKLQDKDQEVIMWALTTGASFVKPYWDYRAGTQISKDVFEGDVALDIGSTFDILWDKLAKNWSEVRWIIHKKVRTIDYIEDVYGKKVAPDEGIICNNIFDSKLGQINNLNSFANQYTETEDSSVVYEYWEKSCKKYPKGRRVTIASGVLLYYVEDIGFGDKDKSVREFPFFFCNHIEIPGRPNGQSTIENLIPIQRERNRVRSQIIQNSCLMGNPVWVVEEDSVISEINNAPGSIIEYEKQTTREPKMVQPPSVGAEVMRNLEMLDDEFYFISSQSEATLTTNKQLSGVALSYMIEEDMSKIAPTIRNFYRCKEGYMSYMLKLVKIFYDVPRTIKYTDKDNGIQVVRFKGSDLATTDVKVITGSSLPSSKSAKIQVVFDLIKNGILNPATNLKTILKMLDLGLDLDPEEVLQNQQMQQQQEMMMQQQQNQPNNPTINPSNPPPM